MRRVGEGQAVPARAEERLHRTIAAAGRLPSAACLRRRLVRRSGSKPRRFGPDRRRLRVESWGIGSEGVMASDAANNRATSCCELTAG
jgi:hypothetical protein